MGCEIMENRHWKSGFQTLIKNDLYRVEERLQAYDPTLYIMYNTETDEHLIMDGQMEIAIMRIPQRGFPVLDSHVYDHIRRIHTATGFSAEWELKESENRRLREQERITEDISYNLAADAKKDIKRLAYGY